MLSFYPGSDVPRGGVRFPERYKQTIDFSGLQFERNQTPTDIDMAIEFNSRELIIGEFKRWGAPVSYGQRRFITTLILATHQAGMETLAFIARHDTPTDEAIPAHNCRITEYLCPKHSAKWVSPEGDRRVREFIDSWRVWNRTKH